MSKSKHFNTLTENELLTLLEDNGSVSSKRINLNENGLHDLSESFIKEVGLKAGSTFYSNDEIYWLFLKWCNYYNHKPITSRWFFRGLKNFFMQKSIHKNKFTRIYGYLLENNNQLNLSEDEREAMCRHLRKIKTKQQEKLAQRKKRKRDLS